MDDKSDKSPYLSVEKIEIDWLQSQDMNGDGVLN
jgi:hypothetical protein